MGGPVPRAGIACGSARERSVQIEHLLTLPGTVGEASTGCSMLVDSGATCNFVSSKIARDMHLVTEVLDWDIKMADGKIVRSVSVARDVQVKVTGHQGVYDLVVLPVLDDFDVILGRPFLVGSRACVDHASGTVGFGRSVHGGGVRKVKVGKVSSQSAVFGSMVASLAGGQPGPIQDEVLRAYGLAAAPVTSEPVAGRGTVSSHVREDVATVVHDYEVRMKPFVGKLPPSRGEYDHAITLLHGNVRPKARRAIPLSDRHQKALAKELDKLLKAGLIRPSRSEWAAPVFFVPKNENEDRMVCDYRALNSVTMTNSASLPYVKELFSRLSGCVVFSKLDLTSGYHQLRLRESDIPLTGFVTPLGHFEWVVMPFGEKNAPGSFAQLMSQLVLRDLVHSFVIVFQDDILIASRDEQEHVGHVRQVLERLIQHRLWIKPEKCEWAVHEVDFLGHRIRSTSSGASIEPCQSKVEAVMEWPVPTCTSDLRSFLGLANFYRSFVQDFSSIAVPLTALTAHRVKFEWKEEHQAAFQSLKMALCNAPALLAVNDSRPFVLHCDASGFAVGAVLSQCDDTGKLRPVGFFSRKLTDTQLRWDVYEREIYSVVAAMEHWFMHLKGTVVPVRVYTDHRSLEELTVQLLRPKLARWLTVLSGFNFEVVWVPAEENQAADALSRRPDHDSGSECRKITQTLVAQELHFNSGNNLGPGVPLTPLERAAACPVAIERSSRVNQQLPASGSMLPAVGGAILNAITVSGSVAPLLHRVREAYQLDKHCKDILVDPGAHGCLLEDGLLVTEDTHALWVPNYQALRQDILREAHDTPTSGHMGVAKTLARLREVFHWPGMHADVVAYVASCVPCQRNKPLNQLPAGLLKPLPIVGKGDMITIDFVGELPRSKRGFDYIMVVVDKMSKRAYYEPCRTSITAKQAADIVFRRVVREQGLPVTIVSDRDPRFTSNVWRELWSLCGTTLGLATAHHQQTDGQSERQVRTLKEGLRAFVNEAGTDWDLRLVCAELAYNTARHASTGFPPLKLHAGVIARLPVSFPVRGPVVAPPDRAKNIASQVVRQMALDIECAKKALVEAQVKQKKLYDRGHKEAIYTTGDYVWLSNADRVGDRAGFTVFRPLWDGPYLVTAVSDDGLNVTLDMKDSRIHPVFHVSKVKKAVLRQNENENASRGEAGKSDGAMTGAGKETSDHVMHAGVTPCITPSPAPRLDASSQEIDETIGYDDVLTDRFEVLGNYDMGTVNSSSTSEADFKQDYDAVNESRGDEDQAIAAENDDVLENDMIESTMTARPQRRRAPPDRFMHAGRLGDQLGLA